MLELIGTAVGAWKWAAIDPVLGLSQVNSPGGVATESTLQYQNVTGGAALVLSGLRYVNAWRQAEGFSLSPVGRWTGLKPAREDIQTPIHGTSQGISSSLKNPDLAVEPLDKT